MYVEWVENCKKERKNSLFRGIYKHRVLINLHVRWESKQNTLESSLSAKILQTQTILHTCNGIDIAFKTPCLFTSYSSLMRYFDVKFIKKKHFIVSLFVESHHKLILKCFIHRIWYEILPLASLLFLLLISAYEFVDKHVNTPRHSNILIAITRKQQNTSDGCYFDCILGLEN